MHNSSYYYFYLNSRLQLVIFPVNITVYLFTKHNITLRFTLHKNSACFGVFFWNFIVINRVGNIYSIVNSLMATIDNFYSSKKAWEVNAYFFHFFNDVSKKCNFKQHFTSLLLSHLPSPYVPVSLYISMRLSSRSSLAYISRLLCSLYDFNTLKHIFRDVKSEIRILRILHASIITQLI